MLSIEHNSGNVRYQRDYGINPCVIATYINFVDILQFCFCNIF